MIVIPMVGRSSRFFDAGYQLPKYMLELDGVSVFEHSVSSFKDYFKSERFLFVVRPDYNTPEFVKERVKKLGINYFEIIVCKHETRGQAETVHFGLQNVSELLESERLIIFNIDTFRPGYKVPAIDCDGYIEVFRGAGSNWSYIRVDDKLTTRVVEVAEKKVISDLCCTGLYSFKNVKLFNHAFNKQIEMPIEKWQGGELYVAPLYNLLINEGCCFTWNLVERKEVIFCGVPSEYEELVENYSLT